MAHHEAGCRGGGEAGVDRAAGEARHRDQRGGLARGALGFLRLLDARNPERVVRRGRGNGEGLSRGRSLMGRIRRPFSTPCESHSTGVCGMYGRSWARVEKNLRHRPRLTFYGDIFWNNPDPTFTGVISASKGYQASDQSVHAKLR